MIRWFRNSPIRRKLIVMLMLISVAGMLMMRIAFFTYEYVTFRAATLRQLSILGKVIANNSTGALAFGSAADANDTLSALRAEPNVVAAGLYDQNGKLFASYPEQLSSSLLPSTLGSDGYRFTSSRLAGFEPVVQRGERLGTLYLEFDAGTVFAAWVRGSLGIALAVMSIAVFLAYLLARELQKQISRPILVLADAAQAVSDRQNYSVRAAKFGEDELGVLTDGFNRMLAELEKITGELEQRVRDRTAQLEAANQELEAFSYSVSHDLRAPLRHVDGFASLLAKRSEAVLDPQSRRYVSTISGAAKQMGRLIDDLLGFSRMGRTALRFDEVDQDSLVATLIRDGHYDNNGRVIAWEIAPLPVVQADVALLRQVWSNLLENAVKYSGKNPSPRVTIGCQPSERDAAEHVLFVRDNGVGFDMAYADKLFGVFQRLHSPTEFEGTGIGLANIRRIVLRHGGRTWAEGRVNEGAVFYFSLPIKPLSP